MFMRHSDRTRLRKKNTHRATIRSSPIEPLERRELLAGAIIYTGMVEVDACQDASVFVESIVVNRVPKIRVSMTCSDGSDVDDFPAAVARTVIVRGSAGNDRIENRSTARLHAFGSGGNDTLFGAATADIMSGGAGDDLIDGRDGADALSGSDGDDTLSGGNGNDRLDGGPGNDLLRGGKGDDTLDGGIGNDELFGELGEDSLDGGGGFDRLVYGPLPRLNVTAVTNMPRREGNDALFRVTVISQDSDYHGVTVRYRTEDGTAVAGGDFEAQSGTLEFRPGERVQTIRVPTLTDRISEPTETFALRLSDATNATIGVGVVDTIIENVAPPAEVGPPGPSPSPDPDPSPSPDPSPCNPAAGAVLRAAGVRGSASRPSLSISDAFVSEGNDGVRQATFIVTLSGRSSRRVTVRAQTENGTAIAGEDFDAIHQVLTFRSGQTSQQVTVAIRSDTLAEMDEFFDVVLTGARNAHVADARGNAIIQNDDGPVVAPPPSDCSGNPPGGAMLPTVSVNDVTVAEGDSASTAAVFTVSISEPVATPVFVRYRLTAGTASPGEDFVPSEAVIVIAEGQTTVQVSVPIRSDVVVEPTETFFIELSPGTYIQPLAFADAQGQATIVNDDAPLAADRLAVFRNGVWFLDTNGDGSAEERTVQFGLAGDTPVLGDFNGDGRVDLGVVRHNPQTGLLDWYLDLAGDGVWEELRLPFGLPGDTPVVGDFDGNGKDDLAVVRFNPQTGLLDWYLDLAGDGMFEEQKLSFGLRGDTPVVGDFDGNGRDEAAVVRFNPTTGLLDWYLDLAGDGILEEQRLSFGLLGDVPLADDWNGDGKTDVGVVRGSNTVYLDLAGDGIFAEKILRYGLPGDKHLAGRIA
jgi:hypothetical protein